MHIAEIQLDQHQQQEELHEEHVQDVNIKEDHHRIHLHVQDRVHIPEMQLNQHQQQEELHVQDINIKEDHQHIHIHVQDHVHIPEMKLNVKKVLHANFG